MRWTFLYTGLLVLMSSASFARILKTGLHQPFTSIHQAIEAAKDGDTVWIVSGIYKEKNITVNKSITLLGNNYPVLDGEHHFEIISVKASRVIIKGLKLDSLRCFQYGGYCRYKNLQLPGRGH